MMVWGRVLWTKLGGGELFTLTFHWPGSVTWSHFLQGRLGRGVQPCAQEEANMSFIIRWRSLPHCPSPLPNQDSHTQKEGMNIEVQLEVSVFEGNGVLRRLQSKRTVVLVPRLTVFSPCFRSHL